MSCSCIAVIDEKLAPMNGRLGVRFTAERTGTLLSTALLVVEKVNPRGKKPPGLLAKFCPICGTAYERPETKPISAPVDEPPQGGDPHGAPGRSPASAVGAAEAPNSIPTPTAAGAAIQTLGTDQTGGEP